MRAQHSTVRVSTNANKAQNKDEALVQDGTTKVANKLFFNHLCDLVIRVASMFLAKNERKELCTKPYKESDILLHLRIPYQLLREVNKLEDVFSGNRFKKSLKGNFCDTLPRYNFRKVFIKFRDNPGLFSGNSW